MWLISFADIPLLNKILLFIIIYIVGAYHLSLLDQYFLAISYVIVYIGAIAILFIFIIMICSSNDSNQESYIYPILFGIVFVLLPTENSLYTIMSLNYLISATPIHDIINLSVIIFNSWYVAII